jgi:mannose-1-phosphate guanylyltransferase/phosphomannomutase
MKAVIPVGRKATRLLPLTCYVPLLEHVIRHLSQHQVKEIILAQGHLSQPIKDYFGDGSQLGVKIHYSYEDIPLRTAGAIKNAERYLSGIFVALNGDSFTDLDSTAMLKFHQKIYWNRLDSFEMSRYTNAINLSLFVT